MKKGEPPAGGSPFCLRRERDRSFMLNLAIYRYKTARIVLYFRLKFSILKMIRLNKAAPMRPSKNGPVSVPGAAVRF